VSDLVKDPLIVGLLGGFLICLALLTVQLKAVAGLPAHPLLLHVPVVPIPIVSGARLP
jgi:hypothetical protein